MIWKSSCRILPPAEQATFRLRALYEGAGYRKYRCSRFEEYAPLPGVSAVSARCPGGDLHRPGRQAAGHQAGRDAVHCQDGPSRRRGSASASIIMKRSAVPAGRATPSRPSTRWAWKAWARWMRRPRRRWSGWRCKVWQRCRYPPCWKSATWVLSPACWTICRCPRRPGDGCWNCSTRKTPMSCMPRRFRRD